MSASFFDYKILEFQVETQGKTNPGFKNIVSTIASIEFSESITSPMSRISILLSNASGMLSKFKLRGGERVRLVIEQSATGSKLNLTEENENEYYISTIRSTQESTKEAILIELVPREFFTNETARVFKRYDTTLDSSVQKILKEELSTTRYSSKNIEKSRNKYSFMGNARKPFTVLGWLCPKGIPTGGQDKKGESGTAGFLFFENQEGYNFKSVDSLFDESRSAKATYNHSEVSASPGEISANFKLTSAPTFKKNVDIEENLSIGMYSSINYYFDTNTRTFYKKKYTLESSYNLMKHSSDGDPSLIPNGLADSPSRLMVSMLDDGQMDKSGNLKSPDERINYQAQAVTRYNLLFSQALNITVPLNLRLTVGDVIILNLPKISLEDSNKGLKDNSRSGKYVISKLKHSFGDKGLTGLQLVRDSYGD